MTTKIDDEDTLRLDVEHALELGFGGKLCIHPSQIEPVHALLAPSPESVAWAERIVEHAGSGVSMIEGEMVDEPVVRRARLLLARARHGQ